ncbi:GNAT family N-acetyltransferase, partial [Serratia ureilytica]|uniref:GNAT family N-acetyltransferase n=1 Tax=Serratia ureilytica TaxID=300181 RepID=UPI001A3218B8|nr:GNAT family N-acetyltransferase [Serratia ureilytica]
PHPPPAPGAGLTPAPAQGDPGHLAEWGGAGAGHRLGGARRLIGAVAEEAKRQGAARLTLTTFIDVPWNAPYYRRLGFRPLADARLTAALRRHLDEDLAHGFAAGSRCAMEFTLS